MGKYIIQLSKQALKDLEAIKLSGNKADMNKLQELLLEIEIHPRTGKG